MKKLGIFSLALIVVLLVTVNTGLAATIIVPDHQPNVLKALGIAAHGDIIKVKPGTYTENILVDKSVKILSTGGKLKTFVNSPTISGCGFWVTSPNVVISGFTVRGGTDSYGIIIQASNVRVRYCTVERSGTGIGVFPPASNVRLSYNQVRYNTAMGVGTLQPGTGILVYSDNPANPIPNVYMGYNQVTDNDNYGILIHGGGGPTSFNGMKMEYNTLVNNGSFDLIPSSNHNLLGFGFVDALDTITLNYNRVVLDYTEEPGSKFKVEGVSPTFTGTGNSIFRNEKHTPAGSGFTLELP